MTVAFAGSVLSGSIVSVELFLTRISIRTLFWVLLLVPFTKLSGTGVSGYSKAFLKPMILPCFVEVARTFPNTCRLASITCTFPFALSWTFFLLLENIVILLRLIGSWNFTSADSRLSFTKLSCADLPFDRTWNIPFAISLFSGVPELRLYNSSVFKFGSNGLMYSVAITWTNFCTFASDERILNGRTCLYISPSGSALEKAREEAVFSDWYARLSVHFRIDLSSVANDFIPPATFESLVYSPRRSTAVRNA